MTRLEPRGADVLVVGATDGSSWSIETQVLLGLLLVLVLAIAVFWLRQPANKKSMSDMKTGDGNPHANPMSDLPQGADSLGHHVVPDGLEAVFFTRRFVVQVRGTITGSGVLLSPRVVATCQHVVEDGPYGADVRNRKVLDAVCVLHRDHAKQAQNDLPNNATVVAEKRHDFYGDIAFLVLKEPLTPDTGPFPALICGMDHSASERLRRLLEQRSELLCMAGYEASGLRLGTASLVKGEVDVHREALVDWYQLGSSNPWGRSGGPVWLVPPPVSGGPPWSPGVVLGLIAHGASRPGNPGPPHSFAVGSDPLIELRHHVADVDHPGAAELLASVRTVDARAVVEAYARAPRGGALSIPDADIDELIALLDLRATKANRVLAELSTIGEVRDVHAQYTDLHTRQIAALRAKHLTLFHEIDRQIMKLEIELRQILQRDDPSAVSPELSFDPLAPIEALSKAQRDAIEEIVALLDLGFREPEKEVAVHRDWERRVVNTLAGIYEVSEHAKQLLDQCGVSRDQLPIFDVPNAFWRRVARSVYKGTPPGGWSSILLQALHEHPNQQALVALWKERPFEEDVAQYYAALREKMREQRA